MIYISSNNTFITWLETRGQYLNLFLSRVSVIVNAGINPIVYLLRIEEMRNLSSLRDTLSAFSRRWQATTGSRGPVYCQTLSPYMTRVERVRVNEVCVVNSFVRPCKLETFSLSHVAKPVERTTVRIRKQTEARAVRIRKPTGKRTVEICEPVVRVCNTAVITPERLMINERDIQRVRARNKSEEVKPMVARTDNKTKKVVYQN
jgi:hypothetical protein